MKRIRSWSFGLCLLTPWAAAAQPVDYATQVKPLLLKNCADCHGAGKQKSGLRLDSAAAVRAGGNTGPAVVPGKSAESLLIHAVTGSNDAAKMPPKGPGLDAAQVALLKRWIDEGAKGSDAATAAGPAGPMSKHWAFQPVRRPEPPAVSDPKWARNPIDHFVLARLDKERVKPSPEADKVTLVRRVYLDLLGLPPTPAEVDRFLTDSHQQAYERLVDRVLASPHYGERWGRHWLDAARYADSNGFTIDAPRTIWKYRDWVIEALNDDLPFDRFTVEQLAGDLLPNPTTGQLVATGFHRNTLINQEGGIDVEQFRVESVVDRVNTTGSVWLGLTVGCAQCHDHKFDPISQREYYQLFAFFNNADEPNLEILSPEERRVRDEVRPKLAAVETTLQALDPTTPALVEKWERGQTDESRAKLPKEILALFEVAPNGRNARQMRTLETAYRRSDQLRHLVGLTDPLAAAVNGHLLTTRLTLERQRGELKEREPVAVTTMIVRERPSPRVTNIHLGGDFLRKGVAVKAATPAVLPPLQRSTTAAERAANRLDLAKWLVSPDNPLTARVVMNRFWGQYFGTGLVETDNDFGTQGTPPSHPELLDWLSSEFVRQKWSMKAMHKLIVTSATYRQSSRVRSAEFGMRSEFQSPPVGSVVGGLVFIPHSAIRIPHLEDPRNRLLARQTRMRLEAEVVRDVALAASGLLSPKVGGPGVFPPQPDGVYRFTQIQRDWKPSAGADRYRRGMYTYFWRSAPHPALVTFDAPDSTTTCTRRNRSNTPLQALTLLNDGGFYEYAQGLAARILKEAPAGDAERLRHAFRVCLSRGPTEREFERMLAFVSAQKADLASNTEEAERLGGDAERAAWAMTARVLLNLDEFITRE